MPITDGPSGLPVSVIVARCWKGAAVVPTRSVPSTMIQPLVRSRSASSNTSAPSIDRLASAGGLTSSRTVRSCGIVTAAPATGT